MKDELARGHTSDVRWTVVRYEDLVDSPARTVAQVYDELGLSSSPEMERSLADEESRSKEYRAEHVYSLREYGLSREKIRSELAPLFDRFGWDQ